MNENGRLAIGLKSLVTRLLWWDNVKDASLISRVRKRLINEE
jgi:hypothetical protein